MTELTAIPLDELKQKCQEQRQIYRRSHGKIKGQCCDEIVRRACQGDPEAWNILFEIAVEIATARCPYGEEKNDFAQEVVLRLIRRRRKPDRPLLFSNFANYHGFLNKIIFHIQIRAGISRKKAPVSLDELVDSSTHEPYEWGDLDTLLEQRRLFDLCLKLLSHPLEREVFLRRYYYREKVSEIVEDLKPCFPQIDSDEVYDLAAEAMRRVRKIISKWVNQSEDKS